MLTFKQCITHRDSPTLFPTTTTTTQPSPTHTYSHDHDHDHDHAPAHTYSHTQTSPHILQHILPRPRPSPTHTYSSPKLPGRNSCKHAYHQPSPISSPEPIPQIHSPPFVHVADVFICCSRCIYTDEAPDVYSYCSIAVYIYIYTVADVFACIYCSRCNYIL